MRGSVKTPAKSKLELLDEQIRRRTTLLTAGYSLATAGTVALYYYFPFGLSRIGSVVLVVALLHMIWKVRDAASARSPEPNFNFDPLPDTLHRIDAQISLIQSLLHNLPFLVGANLFFIGLPGTGSDEDKARLNCYVLAGSVLLFCAFYIANQQIVRRNLAPLRRELQMQLTVSCQ